MATRFASHSEEEIEVKKAKLVPSNTSKNNRSAAKTFREYLCEKNQDPNFESYSKERLDETLGHFYLDARKKDGSQYKVTSLEHFRHGINRYLKLPPHSKKIDIMKDQDFNESNECFKTAVSELKANGKGVVKHHAVICQSDRQKLYTSVHMNPYTPHGLANKVQFDIRMYFCRRGCENMDKMTKNTFVIKTDSDTGLRYVTKNVDELTKNHRDDKESFSGYMPEERGSEFCPVMSFERYLSKLNPKNDRLWQFPLDSYCEEDPVWFANRPIGKDTLSKYMSNLSKQCKLSQQYTNHCIRATGATILSQNNFAASQIMAVTGHKSVSSLAVYQRISADEKLTMGKAIASGISPTANKENIPALLPPPRQSTLSPPFQQNTQALACQKSSSDGDNLPSDLQDLDLDQLFCDMQDSSSVSATQNVSLQMISTPLFSHCQINNLNIVIRK